MKDLYTENHKTLLNEIKDLNKWKDNPCTIRLNIVEAFPGGPVARIPGFYCCGPHSIPGEGTETLQATWCDQKKKTRSEKINKCYKLNPFWPRDNLGVLLGRKL